MQCDSACSAGTFCWGKCRGAHSKPGSHGRTDRQAVKQTRHKSRSCNKWDDHSITAAKVRQGMRKVTGDDPLGQKTESEEVRKRGLGIDKRFMTSSLFIPDRQFDAFSCSTGLSIDLRATDVLAMHNLWSILKKEAAAASREKKDS